MAQATPATSFLAGTDVTGVVDVTAAAEVAALFVLMKALIPDPDTAPANRADAAVGMNADQMHPQLAFQLRHEIDTLAAHIAAAPTS